MSNSGYTVYERVHNLTISNLESNKLCCLVGIVIIYYVSNIYITNILIPNVQQTTVFKESSIKVLLVIMTNLGPEIVPEWRFLGLEILQSHNEVFLAQKSSFFDNFWGQKLSHNEDFWAQDICRIIMTISGARNHHYVIYHQEMTQMPQLPCMFKLIGVITWLSRELQ